jgi:hypothetical protein
MEDLKQFVRFGLLFSLLFYILLFGLNLIAYFYTDDYVNLIGVIGKGISVLLFALLCLTF